MQAFQTFSNKLDEYMELYCKASLELAKTPAAKTKKQNEFKAKFNLTGDIVADGYLQRGCKAGAAISNIARESPDSPGSMTTSFAAEQQRHIDTSDRELAEHLDISDARSISSAGSSNSVKVRNSGSGSAMQKYLMHDAQANERKQKGCISGRNLA